MANDGNRGDDDWDDGGDWGKPGGDEGFPDPASEPGPQTSHQAPQPGPGYFPSAGPQPDHEPAGAPHPPVQDRPYSSDSWGAPREAEPGGPMVRSSKPQLENNDIIAIILSLLLPGVGQIMLGQTTKGIVLIAVTVFTCWGLGFLPILTAIDAYFVAMASKDRALGEWEFFPDYKKYM